MMLPINSRPHPGFTSRPDTLAVEGIDAAQSSHHCAPDTLKGTDYFHERWAEWQNNTTEGIGELRDVAVAQLKYCLERQAVDLQLSSLNLSTLPELPLCIKHLFIEDNQLRELPALPESLITLKMSNNRFVALPDLPPSLETLDVHDNQMRALPELPDTLNCLEVWNNRLQQLPRLPQQLKHLMAYDNALRRLPGILPTVLTNLKINNNQLTHLPESITHLPDHALIDVSDNPLSDRTLQSLQNLNNASQYHGPRIHFSMPRWSPANAPKLPLHEAVAGWYSPEHHELQADRWFVISTEDNAEAFSVFVSELADTASGKNNRAFQQEVAQRLTDLSVSPSLRQSSFAVAQRARTSGENSLAHTYNAMQNAALTHDVKSAKYDNALPELVYAGREMFRRELLEQVAQDKADTLYLGDEFEVYLALQSLLHDALELRSGTLHPYDFEACGVTQDELDVAEMKVKTAENHQFIDWLSHWAPCHSVLQRLEPEAYGRATRARHEAIEGTFGVRVEAQAMAQELDDELDARAEIGRTVMEALPVVTQLLNDRQLGFLLDPRWPL